MKFNSPTETFKDELINLVDEYFPKNETAALGGARSPGRGEAMVLVARATVAHERALEAAFTFPVGYTLKMLPDCSFIATWEPAVETPRLPIYVSGRSKSSGVNALARLKENLITAGVLHPNHEEAA